MLAQLRHQRGASQPNMADAEFRPYSLPIPVALVGFGQKYCMATIQEARDDIGPRSQVCDLTGDLKEQCTDHRVRYKQDASYESTVVGVMRHPGFEQAMYNSLWHLVDNLINIGDDHDMGMVLAAGGGVQLAITGQMSGRKS